MLMAPPQSSKQAAPRLRALFVGPREHRDFAAAWRWLAERWNAEHAASVAAAAQLGEFELIVLGQPRPRVFDEADVARLLAASPLARVILLCGSLCEGEGRSGRPPRGVPRTYWHQWPDLASKELSGDSFAQLPFTASGDEDRFLSCTASRRGEAKPSQEPLVAILAASSALADLLVDACRGRGRAIVARPNAASPTEFPQLEGVTEAFWSGDLYKAEEASQLAHFARAVRPAGVTALLHFPRPEDAARAIDLGARRVVSLPLNLDQLQSSE